MTLGHRHRAYPTKAVASTLLKWIGCQRFIYNAKVSEDRYFRGYARKFASFEFAPVDQEYSRFISEETKWLREVPSQVLRNGATRWRNGYQRFFKKLGGRPTIHKKHGKQSVWLTSELFTFSNGRLLLGTAKQPIGELVFKCGEPLEAPKSLYISVSAGKWYVSFSTQNDEPEASESETAARLAMLSREDLSAVTIGLDRGVVIPVATSDGRAFQFRNVELRKMRKRVKAIKRLQRKAAKNKTIASKRKALLRERIAVLHRKNADLTRDFQHQLTATLAKDERYSLFVIEDLKIKNMTKSARGTKEKPGRNVKAKSGLNRAILNIGWGTIHQFLRYKARRRNKLAVVVSPVRSSQECRVCGHTSSANRISQSVFVCQACGHEENADFNASHVIKTRGVEHIVSGKWKEKEVKRVNIRRKVGTDRPEPEIPDSPTSGEETLDIACLGALMQSPLTRYETPGTAS